MLKNGARCLIVRPLPRTLDGGVPLRMSSNTVSASGSGASEVLCESYQALSYLHSVRINHTHLSIIHLIIAENLLVNLSLNAEVES